jgi:hypothetical protein
MKKKIHVNRQHLAKNRKEGPVHPTLTVKTYKGNTRGWRVDILGPSMLIDSQRAGIPPLSCGARVWLETDGPVKVDGVQLK